MSHFELIQDRTRTWSFEETVLSIGAASSTRRDRGRSGARPETLWKAMIIKQLRLSVSQSIFCISKKRSATSWVMFGIFWNNVCDSQWQTLCCLHFYFVTKGESPSSHTIELEQQLLDAVSLIPVGSGRQTFDVWIPERLWCIWNTAWGLAEQQSGESPNHPRVLADESWWKYESMFCYHPPGSLWIHNLLTTLRFCTDCRSSIHPPTQAQLRSSKWAPRELNWF